LQEVKDLRLTPLEATSITSTGPPWRLGGTVYTEPPVVGGLVIVAEESKTITALDGHAADIEHRRGLSTYRPLPVTPSADS
jgi:hypothetical protein